ncbi:MAG: DUF1566 domain-containing protein [Candidatus Magnetomorum sp.]|nr:DUF1566 domain-containing protein [Candidatus Magnetomorum sp.]
MQRSILFLLFIMMLYNVNTPSLYVWADTNFQLNFKETAPEMIASLKAWQFGEQGIHLAIDFAPSSFEIQKSSLQRVNELGKALNHPSLKNRRFIIQGHTDNDGNDEFNMSLSLKRAFSVKIYLGQYFSIPGSRISVTGMGERQPIVPNTSTFNKRINRRIEVIPDILPAPTIEPKKYTDKRPALSPKKIFPIEPPVSDTEFTEKQLIQCLVKHNYYVKQWPWNIDLSHETGNFSNFFKPVLNQTIIDGKTRLMWQTEGSKEPVNWKASQQFIENLNQKKFANHSDWRLPSVEEAASLIEHQKNIKGLYINPAFSDIQRTCWTRNTHKQRVWVVFFNYGNIYYSLPENENHVRAVRSIGKK